MKYLFKGKDPETGDVLEKEFDDLDEAEEFAEENISDYPKIIIRDIDTDEIVDSDEDYQDRMNLVDDSLFPDEDSKEGFDEDDFSDND